MEYIQALETYATSASSERKEQIKAYVETVQGGFLSEFDHLKRVGLMMKKLIIGFQIVGLLIALAIFAFYPITRQHAEATRRLLDERKQKEREMNQ